MSRHVRNGQPRNSGAQECGSAAVKALIAAHAGRSVSCSGVTKQSRLLFLAATVSLYTFYFFRFRTSREKRRIPGSLGRATASSKAPRSCVVPEGSLVFRLLANWAGWRGRRGSQPRLLLWIWFVQPCWLCCQCQTLVRAPSILQQLRIFPEQNEGGRW